MGDEKVLKNIRNLFGGHNPGWYLPGGV